MTEPFTPSLRLNNTPDYVTTIDKINTTTLITLPDGGSPVFKDTLDVGYNPNLENVTTIDPTFRIDRPTRTLIMPTSYTLPTNTGVMNENIVADSVQIVSNQDINT